MFEARTGDAGSLSARRSREPMTYALARASSSHCTHVLIGRRNIMPYNYVISGRALLSLTGLRSRYVNLSLSLSLVINLLQLRSESGQAGVARPRGGRPIAWHGRDEDGILYQMRRGEERRGEEDSSETHGGGCRPV